MNSFVHNEEYYSMLIDKLLLSNNTLELFGVY